MRRQRTGNAGLIVEAILSKRGGGGRDAGEQGRGDNDSLQKRGHWNCPRIRVGLLRMNQTAMQGGSFMPRKTAEDAAALPYFCASK